MMLFAPLVCFILLACGPSAGVAQVQGQGAPGEKNILILNTYESNLPLNELVDRALSATLESGGRGSRSHFFAYLERRTRPELAPLAINELIGDVLTLLKREVFLRGIMIEADLNADLPPVVGDRVQLQQVLVNLVLNAADAMAEAVSNHFLPAKTQVLQRGSFVHELLRSRARILVKRPTMICVVDDDPSVRKALKRLLSSAGYEVTTYGSAEEVLTSGRGEMAGALVIDVRMPGLSGLELQRRLVASGSRVPVIFITAYRDDQARTLAHQAGAVAYLEKPVDGEVLLGANRAGLERQTFETPEA